MVRVSGRYVIVYANGQGAQLLNTATQQAATPVSGASAPGDPLYVTASNPTVMVGGVAANLAFSGLAPGFVGLWQLNVQVPANAPVGNAVPLVITFGERASSVTTVAVH